MKKYVLAIFLIIVSLAILIPFGSSNPDGLKRVAQTYGAQEHQNFWSGIMEGYSFFSISNQYISTFASGIFGVAMVLVLGWILSKTLNQKLSKSQEDVL